MSRNLSEDSAYKTLANATYRIRQLERRPCQPCNAATPLQTYRAVSGASINAAVIASCPATFYGHQLGNDHPTAFRYVHLFDQTTMPTSMAGVKLTFSIPWQSGANQEYDDGIDFDNGIAIAMSTSPSSLAPVEEGYVVANIAYVGVCSPTVQFTGLQTDTNQLLIEGTEPNLPDVPATPGPPPFTGREPATPTTSGTSNQLFVENPEAATGFSEAP